MASIHLLDTQTANLIAAGEVVERPANVLKELLENAIDAGSTQIITEIWEGGIEMIRVTDNGCGMDKEDLPLCIRRHATSKIRTGADLAAIHTLGFRGEALAAISSTSRFTILSKRKEDEIGHQLSVEGEENLSLEECGASDGTTIIVRDLFFNQPARRKFLKRAQTESAAILQYIQRIAVSHPEIAFRHIADGVTKLQTVGNSNLFDCIYSVYGKEFSSSLVPLSESTGPYRLSGYITRPEMARNNHSYQSFYINSRYVKSRTMQFALEDAYKSFVKSEKFPGCVLFLELDAGEVDVNVHPAKLEVRFSDEKAVYQTLYACVRKTLTGLSNELARDQYREAVKAAEEGKKVSVPAISETKPKPSVTPQVKFGSFRETKFDLPLFSPAPSRGKTPLVPKEEAIPQKKVTVEKAAFVAQIQNEDAKPKPLAEEKSNPNEPKAISNSSTSITPPVPKEETVPQQLEMEGVLPEEENTNNPLLSAGVIRGVLFNAFILYETKEKVYLVDKHAAHERILYEALKKNHKKDGVQLFLEPLLIHLSLQESAAISEHLEELSEAGFFLEAFGDQSFLLRGIPMEFTSLSQNDMITLIEGAAKEMQYGGKAGGAGDKKFDRTLYSMACKAAVKAGIPSTENDHQWLIEQIRQIDNITVCPHGRPILVSRTKKEIESLFLRT